MEPTLFTSTSSSFSITFSSCSTAWNLLTCEVIAIAFLVLGCGKIKYDNAMTTLSPTLSAKVSTFLRIRSFSALFLSFLDAPGAVLVHVVPVAGGAHGGQGVLVARDALAALNTYFRGYLMTTLRILLTNLLLGFWQYFSIGAPHCLPPFLHLPQSLLVRSNQQGASATGLGFPLTFLVSVYFRNAFLSFSDSLGHF